MTYKPEHLEAYREDIQKERIDRSHMAVIIIDALDVIKGLVAENERHESAHGSYCEEMRVLEQESEAQAAEIEKFRDFIKGVKEFDPRTDHYATGLMDECNDVLGLCRCCGEKVCEETE